MKAKTMVCWLLLAALMLLFVPTAALADGTYGGLTVTGGAENTDYSYDGSRLTILTGTPLTLSGNFGAYLFLYALSYDLGGGETGAWYKIEFNGKTAYISASYFRAGNA